jgi:hypothetical protein
MVRDVILQEIAYETTDGVHTYHSCAFCGKHPARGERCAECWRLILEVMDRREDFDDIEETDAVDGC